MFPSWAGAFREVFLKTLNHHRPGVGLSRLLDCGRYQLLLEGQREVVEVDDHLMDQWPSQRVQRLATFLSGSPRFPIPVSELISWGCEFRAI